MNLEERLNRAAFFGFEHMDFSKVTRAERKLAKAQKKLEKAQTEEAEKLAKAENKARIMNGEDEEAERYINQQKDSLRYSQVEDGIDDEGRTIYRDATDDEKLAMARAEYAKNPEKFKAHVDNKLQKSIDKNTNKIEKAQARNEELQNQQDALKAGDSLEEVHESDEPKVEPVEELKVDEYAKADVDLMKRAEANSNAGSVAKADEFTPQNAKEIMTGKPDPGRPLVESLVNGEGIHKDLKAPDFEKLNQVIPEEEAKASLFDKLAGWFKNDNTTDAMNNAASMVGFSEMDYFDSLI